MASRLESQKPEILEAIASKMEAQAKAKIGLYQDEVGPFNAWSQLKPETQRERVRHGYTPNDPLLRSGDLRDSYSHEIAGDAAIIGSDSMIAVYQELGTHGVGVDPETGYHVPPRPVLGPVAYEAGPIVEAAVAEAIEKAIKE